MQVRNRDTDVENKRMDTKGGKLQRGGGGGMMNWVIGIDMYTLMCIKLITNKNLLYKKINKIKFKNSRKKVSLQITNAQSVCRKGNPPTLLVGM